MTKVLSAIILLFTLSLVSETPVLSDSLCAKIYEQSTRLIKLMMQYQYDNELTSTNRKQLWSTIDKLTELVRNYSDIDGFDSFFRWVVNRLVSLYKMNHLEIDVNDNEKRFLNYWAPGWDNP
jgi:hypothetical protein